MKIGSHHSEETKRRISAKLKGRKIDPDVILRRINTRMRLHPIWHTEETRKKLGDAREGKKHSEETKKKISEAASKRKASLTERGRRAWARRMHTHSEETKRKISASMSKYHATKDDDKIKLEHEISDSLAEFKATQKRKKERRKFDK